MNANNLSPEKLFDLPLQGFPGIGIKRAQIFAKLGVYTAGDLLRHFPRAYQNRGNIRTLSEAADGETCAFMLTVGTQPRTAMLRSRKTMTKFTAFDKSGKCNIIFFNQNYVKEIFTVGDTFRFWGKISKTGGKTDIISPAYEHFSETSPLADFTPIYPLGGGLTQKIVSGTVALILDMAKQYGAVKMLPRQIRTKRGLTDASSAYEMIHRPKNYEDIKTARDYFAFEELYVFSLGLSVAKGQRSRGTGRIIGRTDMKPFVKALGFELTGAQKRAINDIYSDMCMPKPSNNCIPMSRLVVGDVGSGKTAVAAAAIYMAVKNGYQAAMMAPTEILACQHYEDLSGLFSSLGFSTALLTGSVKAAEKRIIKERIASGDIDILIGTHALITADVRFKKNGLVVTDEQHRFGVAQRASLGASGEDGYDPHVLVMSATPIPRTLALMLYGDLDLSLIDEMPPGRQKVSTYVVDESYRERVNGFIRKCVSEGGQVYIVCPAVESSEEEEDYAGDILDFESFFDIEEAKEKRLKKASLKSAVDYAGTLKAVFPDFTVEFLHGKMKGSEKDAVMRRFAEGKTQILVSTTVIEVGVNVPNASLMIVENADRFGLSQLHQLRGRVGRGKRKSYCILVSESSAETAKKRLEIMRTTYSGYKIAEYDLEMRGPGDFFPGQNGNIRQHGGFKMSIASLSSDMNQLNDAMAAAENVLAEDPLLENPENIPAARKVREMFYVNERAMQ